MDKTRQNLPSLLTMIKSGFDKTQYLITPQRRAEVVVREEVKWMIRRKKIIFHYLVSVWRCLEGGRVIRYSSAFSPPDGGV
jgi:hypothetical protein